jgi:hypothetical protein
MLSNPKTKPAELTYGRSRSSSTDTLMQLIAAIDVANLSAKETLNA